MVPVDGYLIMLGVALVLGIGGWGGYGAYLAVQKGHPAWKGAVTGLAGRKGIEILKNLPENGRQGGTPV